MGRSADPGPHARPAGPPPLFAALYAREVPVAVLAGTAGTFTPRFQVMGSLVLLDVSGVSRLFGDRHALGQALAEAAGTAHVALGSTAAASLLLSLAADRVTVVEAGGEAAALAPLPIDVLADFARARLAPEDAPGVPAAIDQGLSSLGRWGIRTLGALAALPRPDVHQRLGDAGVAWQRLAAGEDTVPLVPWMAEPVFGETIELEWPLDGLEPLSFVLARVFEPLAIRLERADRGAMAIRTALRLTTRAVHLRTIPLPAPMRDPKTLRTLVLLDLESHPPDAAIDRVQVLLDPAPGRVLQWTLFERARPAPEQVSTLLARLTALVGPGHVGSAAAADTWKPGAFEMQAFEPGRSNARSEPAPPTSGAGADPPSCAFRRFRLPVPVRVGVEDGRPVRVITDRHGITGGPIVQAAGPWRVSGDWWRDTVWDRDEWEIAMADGTIYRLAVERDVGQWFLDGIVD